MAIGIRPIDASGYRLGILLECVGERLNGIFSRLGGSQCGGWDGCDISRSADVCPRRTIGGNKSAWGVTPSAKPVCDRVLGCQMGNGWYGNGNSFFILGLLRLLSTEEGQLAFCGGFREIPAVRLFIVGHGAILVLLFGLFLGFLPGCIVHVTAVALVTVWLSFTELVVGGLMRGGRCGAVV